VVHLFRNDGGDGEEVIAGGIGSETDKADILIVMIESERREKLAGGNVDGDDGVVVQRRRVDFTFIGDRISVRGTSLLRSMLSTIFS